MFFSRGPKRSDGPLIFASGAFDLLFWRARQNKQSIWSKRTTKRRRCNMTVFSRNQHARSMGQQYVKPLHAASSASIVVERAMLSDQLPYEPIIMHPMRTTNNTCAITHLDKYIAKTPRYDDHITFGTLNLYASRVRLDYRLNLL